MCGNKENLSDPMSTTTGKNILFRWQINPLCIQTYTHTSNHIVLKTYRLTNVKPKLNDDNNES